MVSSMFSARSRVYRAGVQSALNVRGEISQCVGTEPTGGDTVRNGMPKETQIDRPPSRLWSLPAQLTKPFGHAHWEVFLFLMNLADVMLFDFGR